MTALLELNDVSVAIGQTVIVSHINLQVEEGSIGCLLGPSGCGKTTLLRGIAGFERTVEGEIRIASRAVSSRSLHLPVEKRQVGMVFQDYALFPHLNVRQNIEFGLTRLKPRERTQRTGELAEMLKISALLDAWPHQLSGGQQQRVAVARAMAPKPRILLLDEPFASLDVELREEIAREIRQVLRADGITAILVSHNQLEAFAMADEIGVMRGGHLLQWSSAFELYHRPASIAVADFVGEGVFITGQVTDEYAVLTELGQCRGEEPHGYPPGTAVTVLIRPDDVVHEDGSKTSARVVDKAFRGAEFLYELELGSGARILSLVPSHHDHGAGEMIGIRLEMDHLVLFPVQPEETLAGAEPGGA